MKIPLDIETIPGQKAGLYDSYLESALNDFKAPSTLTKSQAALDLGITDAKEIKFISKDELISKWTDRFRVSKAPEVAEYEWRRTALDGGKGEVISIVAICGKERFSYYRRLGAIETETDLITRFFQWVRDQSKLKIHKSTPFFIGHNITFDLKFLLRRAVILGIDPQFNLLFNGVHDRHYFCNSQAWCGRGEYISQNDLASALGIPPKPDDIDGSKVWDFVKAGNEKRVNKYNEDDVNAVVKIYNKLNFNKDLLWHVE